MRARRTKMIRTAALPALMALTVLLYPGSMAVAGEFDQIDAAKVNYQASDDPQPFVAYVYIESNRENPYNNEYRDISIDLGGDMDLYVSAKHYTYNNDWIYDTYHVIRFTGELPKNSERAYFVIPRASDMNGVIFSHMGWFFDEEIRTSGVHLRDGCNEFFLVGGSDEWVRAHGKEKLQELYDLFHSDTGEISGCRAEQEHNGEDGGREGTTDESRGDGQKADAGGSRQEQQTEAAPVLIEQTKPKKKLTPFAIVLILLIIGIPAGKRAYLLYRRNKADENTYED